MRGYRQACAAGVLAVLLPSSAAAQTSGVPPPRPDFIFHDERVVGPFTVERWVNAANPEVSPAGTCECLTTVYAGGRLVLTLGEVGLASAIALDDPSGRDITGDGLADLIVTDWSGGAHCCYSTSAYSLESDGALRRVLQLATGSCQTRFEDLDGDQRLEAVTCEDGWAGENCSFAEASFAPVVLAYDTRRRTYVPATPRYGRQYDGEIAQSTRQARAAILKRNGRDAGLDKCDVLAPVLPLLYTGRVDQGVRLLRELYRHADRAAFEASVLARMRSSPLWVAR